MKFSSALIFVFSYLCIVEGEQCTTPGGGQGNCISIRECEPLLQIIDNAKHHPLSPEQTARLRNSQCGFDGNTPKVCCPEEFCFTPDGQEGKCVSQRNCPHIVSMLAHPNDEINAFVHNSICSGPGLDASSVCCGKQPPNFGTRIGNCSSTDAPLYPGSKCCGLETAGDRIIGGEDATLEQYPWIALIEYNQRNQTKLMCGGNLISGRYVLTAGHCVAGNILRSATPINVRLGEHDTRNSPAEKDYVRLAGGGKDHNDPAVVIPIEKIIPHENYNPYHREQRNDIALIRLKEMAPYTQFIRPICLPQTDITTSNLPAIKFVVAGWGFVNTTNSSPTKQFVEVPYVNIARCQPSYSAGRMKVDLWSGQVCAGGELEKDACKGDSGGPLMYSRGFTHELVGVVSFGPFPCGRETVPGVYTKVYEYLPWIRKNIRP